MLSVRERGHFLVERDFDGAQLRDILAELLQLAANGARFGGESLLIR